METNGNEWKRMVIDAKETLFGTLEKSDSLEYNGSRKQ